MADVDDPHKTEVAGIERGIRMEENDSYEVLINGLKRSAEGARSMAVYIDRDQFDFLADILDRTRVGVVRLAGRSRPMDSDPTAVKDATKMTRIESYNAIYEGLNDAARAARQFATGHRGSLKWSIVAQQLDATRDRASELVRRRTKTSNFLITP